MSILIIDTSKPTVWVALVRGEQVVAEQEWEGDRTVGTKLLAAIEEVTGQDHPERIAVHCGPGHFMAVRTGVVTAQLLTQAWNAELVQVAGTERSSLITAAGSASPVAVATVQYQDRP